MKPFHSDDRFTVLSSLIAFFTLFYFFQRKISTLVHRFTAYETIQPVISAAKLVTAIATGVICRVKSVAVLHEICKYVKKDRLKPILDEKLLASRGLVHQRGLFFASDLDFCKKIMNSSTWRNRMEENHFIYCLQYNKPLGLIWGGGEFHKRARGLTTKLLHQLDFYKSNHMESLVVGRAIELMEWLEKQQGPESGKPGEGGSFTISPHELFQPYVLSIVWQIMFGRGTTIPSDDPAVSKLHKTVSAANREFTIGFSKTDSVPFFGMLRGLRFMWLTWSLQCDMYTVFREIIKERRGQRQTDPQGSPDCFLDGWLDEVDRTKGEDPYLTEDSLLVVLRDIFFGASDTVSSVLEFALLHIALNESVRDKLYAEVNYVVGSNPPSYSDRTRMVYTQAVLLEALRYGSVLALGPRMASDGPTVVDGITFPRGATVLIRSFQIHRSEHLWDDPHVFRPERFISNGGELTKQGKIIPFGYGKRACIGESVGQLTLFIFLVTLLQKFTFDIPPELPRPSLKTQGSFARTPEPYYLRFRQT